MDIIPQKGVISKNQIYMCLKSPRMHQFEPIFLRFPGGACPPDPPSSAERLWRSVLELIELPRQ